VSEKFNLNFSDKPSLFEGKTIPPTNADVVKLQILAADRAGNFGQHTLDYRISP